MKYILFSLDCELAWGFADLDPPIPRVETMRSDPTNVRSAYRTILGLFDEYDIPATFAFVGHLFLDECTADTHPINDLTTPSDPMSSIGDDPLYYGSDLVKLVADATVDHEIGGHAFSHPVFDEIDSETASAELQALISAADEHGVTISSFVFPRNAVAHTEELVAHGIDTYRTFTVGENYILRRGLKPALTGDSQFWSVPPVRPNVDDDGLTAVGGSRLLHEVRWSYIHPLRLRRTINQMNHGEVVHFCFHPHDMLGYFKFDWVLERVLAVVEKYRDRGDVEVVTMADMPQIATENATR